MALICGIDEAGRGPVIGPLVLAGVAISEENMPKLDRLGVRDSKMHTPAQREVLFKQIIKIVDSYHIIEVSPKEIDQRNGVGTNLNKLEAIKAADIVNNLSPSKVILDSPEPTAEKFGTMVAQHLTLDEEPEIISEHKADDRYKIVSAASILSKVTRDRAIKEIQKLCKTSFGSGYPSDPICKDFMENGELKQIDEHIRKCWSTYQKAKEKKEQLSLSAF